MSIIVYGVYKRREKQGPLNCTWLNMVNICTKYVCLALCIQGLPKDTWLSDRFDPWYCPSAAANLIQLNSHDCWLRIISNQTIISGSSSTQNVLLIRQEHQKTMSFSKFSATPHKWIQSWFSPSFPNFTLVQFSFYWARALRSSGWWVPGCSCTAGATWRGWDSWSSQGFHGYFMDKNSPRF